MPISVFRKSYTRPVPEGATLTTTTVKRRGRKVSVPAVRFVDARGQAVIAPLAEAQKNEKKKTDDGDPTPPLRYRAYSPYWYGRVRPGEKPVRLKKSRQVSELLLARMQEAAERGDAGVGPDPGRLAHGQASVASHLADFLAHLLAKGDTRFHARQTAARVRRAVAGAAAAADQPPLDELPLSRLPGFAAVDAWLAAQRQRKPRPLSAQTSNHYAQALRTFGAWLASTGRLAADPYTGRGRLSRLAVEPDRRHPRRELTAGEVARLLAAALASAKTFRGLTGRDRHHLYACAVGTGFRAGALARLTPAAFALDGTPPTVTLAARHNKSKKLKPQPLPPGLAELMRGHLQGKPAGEPVWPGSWAGTGEGDSSAAEMLRLDLADAGIPYATPGPDGVTPLYADFHALRHTYLTLLGKAGVTLQVLRELAGHADARTTQRYVHVGLDEMAKAVARLPPPTPPPGQEQG